MINCQNQVCLLSIILALLSKSIIPVCLAWFCSIFSQDQLLKNVEIFKWENDITMQHTELPPLPSSAP